MPSKKSELKENPADKAARRPECCRKDSRLFWPIAMIGFGLVWLAKDMGWLDRDIPWFPLFLIVCGVYLIIRHTTRHEERKAER
jgi:fatty acid desaturase